MKSAAALAVIGALIVAVGIAWVYPPAGVIALGVEALISAYAVAYLKARAR